MTGSNGKLVQPDCQPELTARALQLVEERRHRRDCSIDKMFVVLMLVQWAGGIVIASAVSPRTWIGANSSVHLHVWAAIVIGAIISAGPIAMAFARPGQKETRHTIAIAQMLWSALLIHLSGGRIETHFHVFGSLAFLAFYGDISVLATATVVVAADHMLRGIFWPQSVYGVLVESPYRWIEHAGWVLFEDVCLVLFCIQRQREGQEIADRQAQLELTNAFIEEKIQQGTRELRMTNDQLESEIGERRSAETERTILYKRLMESSRQVGMAEMATGVLHNVGNVLNSVNVSVELLYEKLRVGQNSNLGKVCDLLDAHQPSLGDFLKKDARGQQLPNYLRVLSKTLEGQRQVMLNEMETLRNNVDHIKKIVSMQQTVARAGTLREPVQLSETLDDALRLNDPALSRHRIQLVREFSPVPEIVTERHKLLQIIVNLVSNAKQAITQSDSEHRRLTIRIAPHGDEHVILQVRDTGVGIAPGNIAKIFSHGFTTRADGHGFGLHSSALAASQLGGSLSVASDGVGRGACFTLTLPIRMETQCRSQEIEEPEIEAVAVPAT